MLRSSSSSSSYSNNKSSNNSSSNNTFSSNSKSRSNNVNSSSSNMNNNSNKNSNNRAIRVISSNPLALSSHLQVRPDCHRQHLRPSSPAMPLHLQPLSSTQVWISHPCMVYIRDRRVELDSKWR